MPNREKIKKKAQVSLAKAEKLMDNDRTKKAAEEFQKAGEGYYELGEWRIAEQCFLYASKNLSKINRLQGASNLERLAANCCLFEFDYKKARDYYDVAVKSILKSDSKNRDEMATTNVCFAFLCLFIQGFQDEALAYIKKFKSEISPEVFNNNLLVELAKNLTNAIVNEKEDTLQIILNDYPKYKFRAAEGILIKACVVLANVAVSMKFSLNLTGEEFEMDKLLELNAKISGVNLKKLQNNSVFAYKFESLLIKDVGIAIGDNLSLKDKPNFPISVNLNSFEDITLPFKFRTNFPGRGFIGPLMLTIEVDHKYHLFLKSEVKNIRIVSPQAVLNIELKTQKPPLYNQVFELDVILSNKSDGEAVDLDIEFEFPEQLKMIRGTFKKNIYALRPNEVLKWQIQAKGTEIGELPIKSSIRFKDPNGNQKDSIEKIIPITING